jgi:ABC-type uncharacterized transport system substrate-binding protein
MRGTHFYCKVAVFTGFLAAVCGVRAEPRPVAAAITVVANTSVEAHRAAIDGIRAAFSGTTLDVRVVDLNAAAGGRQNSEHFAAPGTRVIIAVGSDAIQLVATEKPEVPVISTMVLRSPTASASPTVSPAVTISLDVPLQTILARMKQVFPGKTRLGIIRNPKTAALAAGALQVQVEQQGFTARVVECSGIEQLLAALQKLKGEVDFVWCLPDGMLYNSASIKPLILSSIDNRLPLIGFSEGFARAGAAIGIYPDFRDVGVQTGQTAQQIMAGQTVRSAEGPRKVKIAVNQSVLRLLGMRYTSPAANAQDFVVLE